MLSKKRYFQEVQKEYLKISKREKMRLEEIFVSDKQAQQLKKMSAKTIDRLLEHEKSVRLIAEKYEHKNMPLLYQKIPTKYSIIF